MKTFVKNLKPLLVLGIILILLTGCQSQAAPSLPASVVPPAEGPAQNATSLALTPDPLAGSEMERVSAGLLLDPALAQDADSLRICGYLYEGLVRLDANGAPVAGLAESWVVSDDQLDYIFTLRAGMTFSDGAPITPDAVVANFNRWFDPQDPLHGQGDYAAWKNIFLGFHGEKDANDLPVSPVDGIQKVDQNTVLIHLNRPMPEMLASLANPAFAILSPAALAGGEYGGRESAIISSGPFAIESWTDEGLRLGANPQYWGDAPLQGLQFGWKK